MLDIYQQLGNDVGIDLNVIELVLFSVIYTIPQANTLLHNFLQTIPSITSIQSYWINSNSNIEVIEPMSDKIKLKANDIRIKALNLHSEIISFLYYFLQKISSNDNEQYLNQSLYQHILLEIISLLTASVNSYDKINYDLIEQYEEFFMQLIIKEKALTLIMKKIIYNGLVLMIKIKYESFMQYEIQRYILTHDKDKEAIDDIIMNTIKKDLFISNNIPLYSIKSRFDCENRNEKGNRSQFTIDQLNQLFLFLISINDLITEQSKINQPGDSQIARSSITDNCYWYTDFLFYFIRLYNPPLRNKNEDKQLITYDTITALTNKALNLNNSNSNEIDTELILSVSIQFTSALIVYNIMANINTNNTLISNEVRTHIEKIMQYYTHSYHKYLNRSIVNSLKFILEHCTIKDIKLYFKDNKDNIFFHYKYSDELALRVINTISQMLYLKNHYLYDVNRDNALSLLSIDTNKHHHLYLNKLLLDHFISNSQKLIEYRDIIILEIDDLLASSKCYVYSDLGYVYNINATEYIQYLLSMSNSVNCRDNKEMKKMLLTIACLYQRHLITCPQLLFDLLLNIAKLIELEPSNYHNYLDLKLNFQIKCTITHIIDFLTLMQNNVLVLSLNENKFLIDFIINIIKENVIEIIETKYHQFLEMLFSIMNTAAAYNSLIEYITSNVLVFYINSVSVVQREALIIELENVLMMNSNEMKWAFMKPLIALHILCVFTKGYYLYVPDYVQDIIIFFRKLNRMYNNIGELSRIIKKNVNEFTSKYKYSLCYVQSNMSVECRNAIKDLMNTIYYFS